MQGACFIYLHATLAVGLDAVMVRDEQESIPGLHLTLIEEDALRPSACNHKGDAVRRLR